MASNFDDPTTVNHGDPVEWAPHIPIWLSLAFIIATLAVATVASLVKSARDGRAAKARNAPAGA